MSFVFSMMTPVSALTKYNLGLFDVMDDEKKLLNFLRMEKWLADRPDHPGEAAKQWLKDLYQDNKLVKGEFTLGGAKVDLKRITMPVLNVFAEEDHIIPPKVARHMAEKYTAVPVEVKEFPGRPHFPGAPGWEEVADYAFDWAQKNARVAQPA